MQTDCCASPDGRATRGLLTTQMARDPVGARRTYVASRAGFDATNLALGAHGLLPVIDQMFGAAQVWHLAACEPAATVHR
jgi:hypothetical protein